MANPDVGDQIGPYEIRGLIGKGGMGAVYLAKDHSLDRRVALKVLPEQFARDKELVARFQREAHALAKLRHPNLMHIYTVGEHNGRPFFAMEYIDGSTLSSIIKKAGRIPPAQAAHIAGEVLSALDKVHKAGMIHRDVKPGNIMMDEDGRAVLMDFGLARQEQDVALTADHTVLGTPKYMSPEQAKGERLDARTDVYSLGIVLYEMLTGSPPFRGKTSFEVLRMHIESSVPAPSEVMPDVPPELDAVVARAVAKAREDRFQTVREMAAGLGAVYHDATLARLANVGDVGTEPTVPLSRVKPGFASTVRIPRPVRGGRDARPGGRDARPGGRSPWAAAGLGIAAAAAAAAIAWFAWGALETPQSRVVAGAAVLLWLMVSVILRMPKSSFMAAALLVAALVVGLLHPGPDPGLTPAEEPGNGSEVTDDPGAGPVKKSPVKPKPKPVPAPARGQRVEIHRLRAEPVQGRLISIEVLDDGTTTAKIETDGPDGPRTIQIRILEGDELRVVPEYD